MKNRIDAILNERGKSRWWLSNKTGCTYANISNLCNNKTTSIKFDLLESICHALDCTPNDIFIFTKKQE